MANEISSQITSSVQKISRPVERASVPATHAVEDVSKRQHLAASSEQVPESTVIQGSNDEQSPSRGQLEQAVSDINAYVQTVNRELQFRVDEALPLGRAVVTVIDADTEETIREFPSKEALALAHRLKAEASDEAQSQIEGLIISARA
jgi:flagellar protein FlaG